MQIEITIQTNDGDTKVTAVVIGEFAIHRSYGVHSGSWTLTHVPSGRSFYRGFPSPFLARDCAREVGRMGFKKPLVFSEDVTHENKRKYISAKEEKRIINIRNKYHALAVQCGGGES